jgi:hypothetical protein
MYVIVCVVCVSVSVCLCVRVQRTLRVRRNLVELPPILLFTLLFLLLLLLMCTFVHPTVWIHWEEATLENTRVPVEGIAEWEELWGHQCYADDPNEEKHG